MSHDAIVLVLLCGVTFSASLLLTALVRRHALRHGVIDVPNERSSHLAPTPRGGGIAIVTATTVGVTALYALGLAPLRLLLALAVGGLLVAGVGYMDDRHRLSAGVRFMVHVAAALWALACLGGLPPLRFGDTTVVLGWPGYVLGAVAIVWVVNLFNFMDGIDGIAACEAVFIAACGGLLTGPAFGGTSACAFVFAAASAGFLYWNWPSARIFMGDVGSGYLGYCIAVLAVAVGHKAPAALWVWLILGGVFFVDTTVTLVQRFVLGKRVYEAHREHVYQWLARRWGSHLRVTAAVLAVNVVWLLPCAMLALRHPQIAAAAVLLSFAPLTALPLMTARVRMAASR
jgi:Fuc2NAc and GlcNAc transferase